MRELSSLILKENCGKERNVVTESKQIKVLFLSPEGYLKDNIQQCMCGLYEIVFATGCSTAVYNY